MKKILFIIIGIILVIAIVQGVIQGVSQAGNTPTETTEPEQTPKEKVESALNNNVTVDSLSLSGQFDSEPYSAEISFLAKENLSSNMTVEGMKDDIKNALYTLKESGYTFDSISINVDYPLTDQYGNSENETVIKATYAGETLDKLGDDKHALKNDNLATIADEWWEHDAIK
ncbi:hypothetical protein [Planomicrobium okeanokoites]|uniref:Uncharacterized protein n=1 Tax=Planomicrobium okeanokoites TaxID=244 RepID=A0ABV7KTF2_PLAOK|nr:hypothetical protein [Planomicrobium okeanokoites]TAA71605.1 hypothetical protein D2910_04825 [Planomicrobium okeanokoites]